MNAAVMPQDASGTVRDMSERSRGRAYDPRMPVGRLPFAVPSVQAPEQR